MLLHRSVAHRSESSRKPERLSGLVAASAGRFEIGLRLVDPLLLIGNLLVHQRVVFDFIGRDLLELFCREALILALDLLETGDRRARLLEPLQQAWQARLDAVDVE